MYTRATLALVVLSVLFVGSFASTCPGQPNLNPVVDTAPTLVKTCTNGKLYQVRGAIDPPLNILHVYGTPYEMGFAYGECSKDILQQMLPEFFTYIYAQIDQYIQFLPADLRILIEEFGVEAALEFTAYGTEYYTPNHFVEEMKGIAAGAGVSYSDIYQIAMFPELIKAACSMFGAWGPAIKNTNGTMYQLRALDWGTNSPFQKFPAVTIYHPNQGDGHAFASVSWIGLVGSITGYSSAPVGVCEKVWIRYNGTSTRFGTPFTFVLRDILQYDSDVAAALTRIATAHRTCSIFVGLGDSTNTFTAVEYSLDSLEFWDYTNFPVWENHPKMEGLVYIDKHEQPSHDPCFADLLKQNYGNINPETTLKSITAVAQTGDMHIAIYDFSTNNIYVANAGVYNSTSNYAQPAYDRPFTKLDLSSMFAEKL